MKRTTFSLCVLLGAGVVGAGVGVARNAHSADHLDSPATIADPAADINDLYGWMDGNNLVLAMTVHPAATGPSADGGAGSQFSNAVQYVFHVESAPKFGAPTAASEDIICTFDVAQNISCWAGTNEFVTGNAGVTAADAGSADAGDAGDAGANAGLVSADGKFKVFSGLRADPFFFNLAGFKAAQATVEGVESTLQFDEAGCPTLTGPTAAALVTELSTNPADGGPAQDFFAPLNALAIVVSIDKGLVTAGGPIVSTWASTHTAP